MAFASSDTRTAKLAVAEGDLRFTRPELDVAGVEELILNGPAVLRDPRRDRLYTGSHFFKRAEKRWRRSSCRTTLSSVTQLS